MKDNKQDQHLIDEYIWELIKEHKQATDQDERKRLDNTIRLLKTVMIWGLH